MKTARCLPLLGAMFLANTPIHAAVFRVGPGLDCTHPTLQGALDAAAANGPERDLILVSTSTPDIPASYTLTTTDVTIEGGYASCADSQPQANARTTIRGNGVDSVFRVGNGRSVDLRRLHITGGGRTGIVNGSHVAGGAIHVDGAYAALRAVAISDNRALLGGGIAVTGSSVVSIEGAALGTVITRNEAAQGGGIYVGERASLRIGNDDVLISHNSAVDGVQTWTASGGGIHVQGGLDTPAYVDVGWVDLGPDLSPATRGLVIANNIAWNGGGVALEGRAVFTAYETTLRDNTAMNTGGGVHVGGNRVGAGASFTLARWPDQLAPWLEPCPGLHGCTRITGNAARRGGGVHVMHGALHLAQALVAGNRVLAGGAAINTGNIAGIQGRTNAIRLESTVIAANECTAEDTVSPCTTLSLGVGSNEILLQHVTLADNLLTRRGTFPPYEIDTGLSSLSVALRSIIIEPGPDAAALTPAATVAEHADCVLAPMAIGQRALVAPPPYAFADRETDDYRPAPGNPAVDACDTTRLDGVPIDATGTALGSIDVPGVANRLGADARADIGAFELAVDDRIFRHGFDA